MSSNRGGTAKHESWTVYVDGLNFYSAVRGKPENKWVDLWQLSSRLVPNNGRLERVVYFTAQISAKSADDADSPRRQRVFIRAVSATAGVEVIEGKFQVPDGWRSFSAKGEWGDRLRPPLPDGVVKDHAAHFAEHDERAFKAMVQLPQEKFTDVAIASHLLRDFYQGSCSQAIVVTNDADLRPAIELVVGDGHTVGVFSPMRTISRDLERVATWSKSIRPDLIGQCQMPDDVQVPGSSRVLSRPAAWKNTEAPPKRGSGS